MKDDEAIQVEGSTPPMWHNNEPSLLEALRDRAWERRKCQILRQGKKREDDSNDKIDLTDEDMDELKASIELGFGFCEEESSEYEQRKLSNTLPALDLYFAVNRGRGHAKGRKDEVILISRKVSSSSLTSSGSTLSLSGSSLDSPSSSVGYSPTSDSEWKIISQGDDPKQVKTKLRHWAQAVACSVRQSL